MGTLIWVSWMGKNQPSQRPLRGGELLTAVSNTIVGILRQYYGRGPMKAKTYVMDDLLVCVLRDGLTPIEETMIESGRPERVLRARREFQEMMGERYREKIEELTGSKVVAFMSEAHIQPDILLEVFVLDPPLDMSSGDGKGNRKPDGHGQPE